MCVCGVCVCVELCNYIYTVIQYIDRCLYQKIYNICTVIIIYIYIYVCVCMCVYMPHSVFVNWINMDKL